MQAFVTTESAFLELVTAAPECAVCSGLHDQEIHDATLSIHGWLRREIERRTQPPQFAYGATVEAVAASIVEPIPVN